MKIGLMLVVSLPLLMTMCGNDPGSFSMTFTWDPPPDGMVWIWVRVEERGDPSQAGSILASTGPDSYEFGDRLPMEMSGVPYGDNRVVVAEVRETSNPNQAIIYYGVSEQFSLVVGEDTVVDVPLVMQPPETDIHIPEVTLLFDGETPETVGPKRITNGTIMVHSSGAVSIIVANDASFDLAMTTFSIDEPEGMTCTQNEIDGVIWDECEIPDWNLLQDMGEAENGEYSAFVKLEDRYGYESKVHKASVVLDVQAPEPVVASLTPPVGRPGGEVYLGASFHEQLAEGTAGLSLIITPALPGDSDVSEAAQVADSNAYLWTISIGGDAANKDAVYKFSVDVADIYGNDAVGLKLRDENKEELALTIDPEPPVLLKPGDIKFSQKLFGFKDVGQPLAFEFVMQEPNHHEVWNADGKCQGICPEVRLNNKKLGTVTVDEGEEPGDDVVRFHYDYEVQAADWPGVDSAIEISVTWSDKAGNADETALPETVRFDFVRPTAFSFALLPKSANINSKFTYTLTASEPLIDVPKLKIVAVEDDLFGTVEESADGHTFTWTQEAGGLANQTIELSALLTDLAENESEGQEDPDGYICQASADVDGTPPAIANPSVTTDPEVTNGDLDTVIACGPGDRLLVSFEVTEPEGLPEKYPEVLLSVPGDPIPLDELEHEDLGGGTIRYNYELEFNDLEHKGAEGMWPVRVTIHDLADNPFVEDALADELVMVDFTAPKADCSLIPTPGENAYPIGQKIILQISPIEELQSQWIPVLEQILTPEFPGDFFAYEEKSSYRFFKEVLDTDGERTFEVSVKLTDLVGNMTLPGDNACTDGPLIGSIDGETPKVEKVELLVEDGEIDPAVTPLKKDLVVAATVHLTNTQLKPTVTLGTGTMSSSQDVPEVTEEGLFAWEFTRKLAGNEGEGVQKVTVSGSDEAGNPFSHTEDVNTVTLDFTPPTAQCKMSPEDAKIGDTVVITVNASEPLLPGLAALTADLDFKAPEPDFETTSFEFKHKITTEDQALLSWTYSVDLVDMAGNPSEGEWVCHDSGAIDAVAPLVTGKDVTTDPVVYDKNDLVVLAVGDGDRVIVTFDIVEAQGLTANSPKVYLDVAGNPIELSSVSVEEAGDDLWACEFELKMNGNTHKEAGGLWPIKLTVEDKAGNVTVVEGFLNKLVRVDFIPPTADCSLVPTPGNQDYPIGQKITLQVFPLEELFHDSVPVLVEEFEPVLAEQFFTLEPETAFRFSGQVEDGDSEASFSLLVTATDLVGNTTEPGTTACSSGPLSAALDGTKPEVLGVTLEVDGGKVDPSATPLNAGHLVTAVVVVTNTQVKPTVFLGAAEMSTDEQVPQESEQGVYSWVFERELNSDEGEGTQKVSVSGVDEAGNAYSHVEEEHTVLLDFTHPTAICKAGPTLAGLGDMIAVTVSVSEPLADGLPEFESGIVFIKPAADPDATIFEFVHTVDDSDKWLTEWVFSVTVTDQAGNVTEQACEVGGNIDALAPQISGEVVTTAPEVIDGNDHVLLAAGDQDKVIVKFSLVEAQGLAKDTPEVFIEVAGDPLQVPVVSVNPAGAGTFACHFELLLDQDSHKKYEGTWPVRLVATDSAGNVTSDGALAGALVKLDFTAPSAECALIPAPGEQPYGIGQKITLQVSPVEELEDEFVPVLDETFVPELNGQFFAFEDGTTYRFSRSVKEGDGERTFEAGVRLTDLVGNKTDLGQTACAAGLLAGAIDGTSPIVESVELSVEQGAVDHKTTPLKAGLTVTAKISVSNTQVKPTVLLGEYPMSSEAESPLALGGDLFEWEFGRELSGDEGDGIRKVSLQGTDGAGNAYSYVEDDDTVTLDFTPPTAACKSSPELAQAGDVLSVTVTVSEPLAGGLPNFESPQEFIEPKADPDGTLFQYTHEVTDKDAGLATWSYTVQLTDIAGNPNEGQSACSGGGNLDAVYPQVTLGDVSVDPYVEDHEGQEVLAAGDTDIVRAEFTVVESQALSPASPQVVLDVPGSPLDFSKVSVMDNQDGTFACAFELQMSSGLHLDAEGSWPVKVMVDDFAGNLTVEEALEDVVVRIDFTPPAAECGLVPAPGPVPYAITQKVSLLVSPLEELHPDTLPLLVEEIIPELGEEFFSYEPDTSYRFSGAVSEDSGEHDFTVRVILTDLVDNKTPDGEDACLGAAISGSIDGTRPHVDDVQFSLDPPGDDPLATPLNVSRKVVAHIRIENSDLLPEVKLGAGKMKAQSNQPTKVGEDLFEWVFVRPLDGSEGEGQQILSVWGQDAAGNKYEHEEEAQPLTLDFTAPTSQCAVFPANAKIGDTIVVSINTSEPLSGGLPDFDSDLDFEAPPPDEQGTSFSYQHLVEELAVYKGAWNYSATLCDIAGNCDDGQQCSGAGIIDAKLPQITNGVLTTSPEAKTIGGSVVLVAGHDYQVVAEFNVTDNQDLANGSPLVFLDVSGAPVPFDDVQTTMLGQGSYSVVAKLLMHQIKHDEAEGNWPVRVVAQDTFGNVATVNSLGGKMVGIDFTPPKAGCSLIPAPGQYGYPIGLEVALVVTPLESLGYGKPPVLKQDWDLPGTFFSYQNNTTYRYTGTVADAGKESQVGVDVELTDVVGNATVDGLTACGEGTMKVNLDGQTPDISNVQFLIDLAGVDPLTDPIRKGGTLTAGFVVEDSELLPTVTIGSGEMNLKSGPAPAGNNQWQWQFQRKLNGTEGEGDRSLVVSGYDEAGNPYSYTHPATLEFDFTNPIAQCLVNIDNAKAGDVVELTAILTEKLTGVPDLVDSPAAVEFEYSATDSTPDANPPRYVWKYTVPTNQAAVDWTATISGQDLAGNPNPIASLCMLNGHADGAFITVSKESVGAKYLDPDDGKTWVDTALYAKDGSRVTIKFDLSEKPDAKDISVLVDDQAAELTGVSNLTYTYVHDVDQPGVSGVSTVPVSVTVYDDVDNKTYETLAMLVLDFDKPLTTGTAFVERCDNYARARVASNKMYLKQTISGTPYDGSASAACAGPPPGGTVRVTFGADETLYQTRCRVYADNKDFAIDPCGAGGTIYAVYNPKGTETKNQWVKLYGLLEDLSGNRNTIELAELYFDFDAPATPLTDTDGKIVYTRVPWGSAATSGQARFAVQGLAGAVEGKARVQAYDEPDISTASMIGAVEADASGAFGAAVGSGSEFMLNQADRSAVYLVAVDAAGNISDYDAEDGNGLQASQVLDTVWVATLGGKVPGSTIQNPFYFDEVTWFQNRKLQSDTEEAGDEHGIADDGGDALTTSGANYRWQLAAPLDPFPQERRQFDMAYDAARGVVVMFSGFGQYWNLEGTWEWDGATWIQINQKDPEDDGNPKARAMHSLDYDDWRGVTLLFGGAAATIQDDLWAWDGESWELQTPIDPEGDGDIGPRYRYASAFDSDRGVLVVQGGDLGSGDIQDSTWEWDGESWALAAPSDPEADGNPGKLYRHAMAFDKSREVSVLYGGNDEDGNVRTETWEYDGTSWDKMAPTDLGGDGNPPGLYAHSLVYDEARERVVLYSGTTTGSPVDDLWEWDGTEWDKLVPADPEGDGNAPRTTTHAMAYDGINESLLLFGGEGWTDCGGYCHQTWLWNGASWALFGPDAAGSTGVAGSGRRKEFAMTYDPQRKRSVIMAGRSNDGWTTPNYQDNLFEWNGSSWTEIVLAGTTPTYDRRYGAMEFVGSLKNEYSQKLTVNKIALFAGTDVATGYLDDFWWYNGSAWTSAVTGPSKRSFSKLAWDSNRGRLVMFGGWKYEASVQTVYNETWELRKDRVCIMSFCYNVDKWDKKTPVGGDGVPTPRVGHGMAFDDKRNRTVMFGGEQTLADKDDTWEWTGSTWYDMDPLDPEADGNPAKRSQHSMAWDPVRERSLMFGGKGELMYDDLWEWDGTSWRKLVVADIIDDGSPMARADHNMVYHTARGEMVLCGGDQGGTETWRGISGALEARPGHIWTAPFYFAGHCGSPEVSKIAMEWDAGGTGHSGVGNVNGAQLMAWQEGRWKQIGTNSTASGSSSTISWNTVDAAELDQSFTGDYDTLTFAAVPKGYSRYTPAKVTTDYAQLTLTYQVPHGDALVCDDCASSATVAGSTWSGWIGKTGVGADGEWSYQAPADAVLDGVRVTRNRCSGDRDMYQLRFRWSGLGDDEIAWGDTLGKTNCSKEWYEDFSPGDDYVITGVRVRKYHNPSGDRDWLQFSFRYAPETDIDYYAWSDWIGTSTGSLNWDKTWLAPAGEVLTGVGLRRYYYSVTDVDEYTLRFESGKPTGCSD